MGAVVFRNGRPITSTNYTHKSQARYRKKCIVSGAYCNWRFIAAKFADLDKVIVLRRRLHYATREKETIGRDNRLGYVNGGTAVQKGKGRGWRNTLILKPEKVSFNSCSRKY